jgi:hypothetical protein
MTQQQMAERYRLAQAQKLIDLFEDAHAKPLNSMGELEQWVASPEGRAALALHCDKDGKIIPGNGAAGAL